MIWKGFRFGMILQLAIGPMCLFVFQTSIAHGFLAGEMGVLGTAIVDSTEIILAIIGVGIILERSQKAELFLKIFGVSILILYGIVSVLGAFHISILPSFQFHFLDSSSNTLVQAIFLALSDPLTIVFWAGIFSAKISEEHMRKADLRLFACGCVLATLFFLSLISLAGSVTKQVIPTIIIDVLNFCVGVLMFFFAYRNLKTPLKKESQPS